MVRLNYIKYPLSFIFLFGAIIDGIVGAFFLYSYISGSDDSLLKLARDAKVMTLKKALNSNSISWVKVTLQASSKEGLKPLVYDNKNYCLVKQEIYKTYIQEVLEGGKWIKKQIEQLATYSEHFIPFDLFDDTYKIEISSKIGLNFGEDVWEKKEEIVDLHTKKAYAEQSPTSDIISSHNAFESNLSSNVVRIRTVTYLLPQFISNLWVLAKFNNGSIQYLPSGEIVLTKLDPQKFIENLQSENEYNFQYVLGLGLLASSFVLATIAVFLLLKFN